MNAPALRRSLREIVDEYDAKAGALGEAIAKFTAATNALNASCCIGSA